MTSSVGRASVPIRVGLLFDYAFPPPDSWNPKLDTTDALRLTLEEAVQSGQLDRDVELIERNVDGLPRGSVKSVIDAYDELVEEGCILIVGPLITENAIPLREHIDPRTGVPCLSWCGSDVWLGERTFALSDGSLSEEPYIIASVMARAGHRRVGVSVERSAIGTDYLIYLRHACAMEGIDVAEVVPIAQTEADATHVVESLSKSGVDAIVHLGFGFGLMRINAALAAIGWDPPRYTTTAFETGYTSDEVLRAFVGWVGLEHYDEENPVGQRWLDHFSERFGRRPEYAYPLYGHDLGQVVAAALERAEPLSPTGVVRGLEQIRMLPAASGSAGPRISFGPYRRNGWHGAGYLTARSIEPDLRSSTLRGRA